MAEFFISRLLVFLLTLYSVSSLAQTPTANKRERPGRKGRSVPMAGSVRPIFDLPTDDTLRFATSYEPVEVKKPASTSTVNQAEIPPQLSDYQENAQKIEQVFPPKMVVRPALNQQRSRPSPPVNDTETSDLERILNRKKQSN